VEHWSSAAVQHCALRQQRILSAAWQTLRPGGILFYATCSYSAEENEDMTSWLIQEKKAKPLSISLQSEWNITATQPGYRCWPDKIKGEGFYFCCLQKPAGNEQVLISKKVRPLKPLTKKEQALTSHWIKEGDDLFFQWQRNLYLWPRVFINEWQELTTILNVIYSGVRIGQLMGEKLVPDHALALNRRLHQSIPFVSMAAQDAIAYLQRKPLMTHPAERGWCIAAYQQCPLGWVNVLSNRVNNYYPKELRILKENLVD
jgi:NOL1/NOP2/fmu family ribosome biogenesis protein